MNFLFVIKLVFKVRCLKDRDLKLADKNYIRSTWREIMKEEKNKYNRNEGKKKE